MKKKIVSLLLGCTMAFSAFSASAFAEVGSEIPSYKDKAVVAFPGAEGGGMYASGGRGCEVYIVDTLEDYGADEEPIKGSLRDALSQGNRTIVFNVSGTVNLKRALIAKNLKNVTVAGQTAPGDGITITGYYSEFTGCENIIMRYIRFRTGSKNLLAGDSMDALFARRINTAIFDHLSTSWSTDETMSIYQTTDTTVQWSIVSESLTMSGHSKGRHGYGAIWGGLNSTFHHNIVASHASRCPRVSCGYGGYLSSSGGEFLGAEGEDHIGVTDVRNNVFYNWNDYSLYGGGWAETNVVNNYYKIGPATQSKRYDYLVSTGEDKKKSWYHINGNVMEGNSTVTNDNSKGVFAEKKATGEYTPVVNYDMPYKTEVREAVGNELAPYTAFDAGTEFSSLIKTQSAEDAYSDVLAKAGATMPRRDAYDARVIQEIKDGKGRLLDKEFQVGGLPVRETVYRDADFDKDRDGMADEWESANSLDPANPNDGNILSADGSGYTNLENYINSLADMDHSPDNPVVNLKTPSDNQIFNFGDPVTLELDVKDDDPISKVQFFIGEEIVAETEQAPYKYVYNDLADGTYYLSAKVTDNDGNSTQSSPVVVHINTPNNSSVWKSGDIGNVYIKGNAHINKDGTLTVKGNGNCLAQLNKVDNFHFAYQEGIKGDFEISTKISSITDINNDALAGLSVRQGLGKEDLGVTVGLSWAKSTSEVAASGKGKCFKITSKAKHIKGSSSADAINLVSQDDIYFRDHGETLGYYVKIKREGNTFTTYHSPDGVEWTQLDSIAINLTDPVYVGFAVDSNQDTGNKLYNLNTCVFDDIKVSGALLEDPLMEPVEKDILGDIDCNGKVEVNDASLLLEYVLDNMTNSNEIGEDGLKNANVSGNEDITAVDCALILQKALNDGFQFPVKAKEQ